MHVNRGESFKTEAVLFQKLHRHQEDGDTSGIALSCDGTGSFTPHLGAAILYNHPDSHDVASRIRKASTAFGALREAICGTKYMPLQTKAVLYL